MLCHSTANIAVDLLDVIGLEAFRDAQNMISLKNNDKAWNVADSDAKSFLFISSFHRMRTDNHKMN